MITELFKFVGFNGLPHFDTIFKIFNIFLIIINYSPSLKEAYGSAHRYISCLVMNESRKYTNIQDIPTIL